MKKHLIFSNKVYDAKFHTFINEKKMKKNHIHYNKLII